MPMNGTHDTGYRFLFSEPRMVRDLLRGFLREEWIGWLDLDTLERREGAANGAPLDRLDEVAVWRLRWTGGSDWVYLLLRSEAEEDPWTALRMGFYRELLYQKLLRLRRTATAPRLPVALPVVLYHGVARWKAPREAVELFLPLPASLQRHAPRTRYLLLDAAHDPLPEHAGEDNLVSLLCQLERSRTAAAVDYLLERLVALISAPADESLRHVWSTFLSRSLLPRRFPDLFAVETEAEGGVLA
jgi:putative YhgA-like transposase